MTAKTDLATRLRAAMAGAVLGLTAGGAQAEPATEPADQEPPNIVFVLADDFGYGSLNSYGADPDLVRTPHIDRLAEDGVRFTQASAVVAVCTPSRYNLLMGEHAWRTDRPVWRGQRQESGLQYGVLNVDHPLFPNPEQPSLGSLLQEHDYQTAMIGKWHLGYGEEPRTPEEWTEGMSPGPLDLGFDYHFGVPQNHGAVPAVYIEDEEIYGLRSDRVASYSRSFYGRPYWGFDAPQRVNEEVTGDLTRKALDWLRAQDADTPFFLYFAPVAVHHPITPSPGMRGTSPAGPYGDFIQDLDQSVGRIMEMLEYMGAAEDTLFIFSSDDGGDLPGDPERPNTVAMERGLALNGPFRGQKHTIWEGGHRVPFIARWPGRIPPGTESHVMLNLCDVLPTVWELVTGKVPDPAVAAPDGFSFLDALLAPNSAAGTARQSMINANVNGMMAIRRGPWKYIEGAYPDIAPDRAQDEEPQLYNIEEDPGENEDLIEEHPGIAEQLQRELESIREASSERELAGTRGEALRLD
ncbi:MAG: arylsulfatase [Candidatus Hydrogenedentota bacterium]